MNLSPDQKNVVEMVDKHVLCLAAAGSGKTRVLTERVRYLLEDQKIRSRVLALTFTNKAAEEMRQRLEQIDELADRAYIGTIHSFCQKLIELHGNAIGYASMPAILESETDRMAMLEVALRDSPELGKYLAQQKEPKDRRAFLYRVLGKIHEIKRDWETYQRTLQSGESTDGEDKLLTAFRAYQDHLNSQGVIDFDDILLIALRILSENQGVARIYQRSYRYLCVDEAQDLNEIQYRLIRKLGEDATSVLLVGDPKQAIYGFNGSSSHYMEKEFVRDFETVPIELKKNYRSSKAVISAANALYRESNQADVAALDGELQIVSCANEEEEAEWIVRKIDELLLQQNHPDIEGEITLERMVVLARNRYLFADLQRTLEEHHIPFHLRQANTGVTLESEPGKALDLMLRLAINPQNDLVVSDLRRALGVDVAITTTPSEPGVEIARRIVTSATPPLRAWAEAGLPFVETLEGDINQFRKALAQLREKWMVLAQSMERSETADAAGAQAIADLDYLEAIWKNYARSVDSDSRSLVQLRNQMSTGIVLPHAQGTGLMLAPVHTVKGLEFEIVFLMGMVEGSFPDYRAVKAGAKALQEEKNDAFVAVTRAKRLLYLTWPQAKFMPWDREHRHGQRPSRYLQDIKQKNPGCVISPDAFHVAENPSRYPETETKDPSKHP